MELITFNKDKLAIVPTSQVTPNTWNPKEKNTPEFEKIKKAIQTYGQKAPIIVRTVAPDQYEIIDGEQRYTALKELGSELVLIYNEGEVSDKEARELTIWWQQQVPFSESELAFLVADLVKTYQNVNLPLDNKELESLVKLADFKWEEFKMELAPTNTDTTDADIVETENYSAIYIKLTKAQFLRFKQFIDDEGKDEFLIKLTDAI